MARVAAADNGDPLADLRRLAHGNAPQEVDTAQHALQLFAGAAHTGALPRANGDDGRIVLLAEIVKGNVLANADIVLQLDADRGDLLNLFVYDRLRAAGIPECRSAAYRPSWAWASTTVTSWPLQAR